MAIEYDPLDPAQVDDHQSVLARLRREALHGTHQIRAERIARRLSRHQTDPQRHRQCLRLLTNDAAGAAFDEFDEGP